MKWQGGVSSTFSGASAGCWVENNNTAYVWCTDNADPNSHTMEVAAKSEGSGSSIYSEGKSHFTIQDLDIRNSTMEGIKVFAATNVSISGITIQRCTWSRNGGMGILVHNWYNKTGSYPITDVLVDDNIVYENRMHGIEFVWDVQNSKVSNNTVYRNGWDQDAGWHGISTYASSADESPPNNIIVEYNIVYETRNPTGNEGTGIQFDDYTKNSVMRYNKTYNNEGPGIIFNNTNNCECYYNLSFDNDYSGFSSNCSTNIDVYNNVFYNNGNFGVRIAGTCNNFTVKNNIIAENSSYEVYVDVGSGTYTGDYNCIYRSAGGNFMHWKGGDYNLSGWKTNSGQDANSKNQDPFFIDAASGDLRLQSTSPCIDVGTNVSLTEDIAGNNVPYGLGVDIGAYEYSLIDAEINASHTSGEVPLTIDFTGSATGGTEPYTYSWDFGDSTASSEQNSSHTYSDAGNYTATLTVTDSQSNQDSESLIINASAPVIPLAASCAASPTSGEIPLTINFTGNATGGTEPYTYSWDFGDSTSSSEQNPSHTYSDAGDYTVSLTVTDSQNDQDSESLTINTSVPVIPLAASCAASPNSGEAPLIVNFTGSAAGGVPPYSYSWDFGDSTASSEQNSSHTYSDAGNYTATLTVTDSQSNQDSESLIINASAPAIPLAASCAASPTSGEAPLTVDFTGSATGGTEPYTYSWDFGDSTASSEQNSSHTYSDAGDYTVSLTVTDSDNNEDENSIIINVIIGTAPTYLSCSPTSLYFGATTSGNETEDQYLRIINAGSGVLTWNIEDDADWLSCSPSSGSDRGEIIVSVNASGLSLGLYVATITVSSSEAYNSPQYVAVNLRVYESGQDSPPFGYFDIPVDGSTVSGSVPIAGWALDDIEVTRVEIKRNSDPVDPFQPVSSDGLVYIGDAVFVGGARPDVEKSFPDYPLSSRAGWGYMLLTNDLPYRGNGSFTIYTFAHDASGHREEIGRKTILCDNINRVKPFGTIDTPEQGESIRGSDYINFGWALTPLPKTVPKDGNTIWVWVDGVQVGHPVYDQYREDIATLYPEYNNAQGAVGYYYLDTTQYENGMHTIAWSVMDDEGEVDGIGSKYFSIDNIEIGNGSQERFVFKIIYQEDVEGKLAIGIKEVRRGYRLRVDGARTINTKGIFKIQHEKMEPRRRYRLRLDDGRTVNTIEIFNIQIEEMEPIRIVFEGISGVNMNYMGWGKNAQKLPVGSTLDREKGIYSWIPTPGFLGRYELYFAVTDGYYMSKPLRVVVNVIPKSYD